MSSYISPDKSYAPKYVFEQQGYGYVPSGASYSNQTVMVGQQVGPYGSGKLTVRAYPPNQSTVRLVASTSAPARASWGGHVFLMVNTRTNSPANYQIRNVAQRYHFIVYNDGDCDADSLGNMENVDDITGSGYISGTGYFLACSNVYGTPNRNNDHVHLYWDFQSWQAHEIYLSFDLDYRAGANWHFWFENV